MEDASETPAAVFVVVPVASDESPDVSVCGVRIALAIFGSMRCFQLVLVALRLTAGEPIFTGSGIAAAARASPAEGPSDDMGLTGGRSAGGPPLPRPPSAPAASASQ